MKSHFFIVLFALLGIVYLAACQNINETQVSEETNTVIDLFPFQDKKNEKWGYMDSHGNVIIQPKYDYADFFYENTAKVGIKKREENWPKYGRIDSTEKVVIPISYDSVSDFSDGMFLVSIESSAVTDAPVWFYMNENGNTLLRLNYWRASVFQEGLARVSPGIAPTSGFIDIRGNFVIGLEIAYYGDFCEGLAYECKDYPTGKYCFINREGVVEIDAVYDHALSFSEGYAAVQMDGKWGYINKEGETMIPFQFDGAGSFSEGIAVVKIENNLGYISKEGEMITPFSFENARGFKEGVAAVRENGLWGFIDHSGEFVLSPQYPYASNCYNGLIMILKIQDDEFNYLYQDFPYLDYPDLGFTDYKFLYYINLKGDIIEPIL